MRLEPGGGPRGAGPKRGHRPQLPGPVRLSDVALRIGLSVLTAIFSPVMGALLTGYFAYDADQNGRIRIAT